MGCCEANGIRNRLEQINPFKQPRGICVIEIEDNSAPICRKPIFDDNSTQPYKSESQYYSYKTQQFRVSRVTKSPNKYDEFNTNQQIKRQQQPLIQHRVQTQQAISCPPIRQQTNQYLSNQSFSVPVSTLVQQPQYVVNSQPQQHQPYVVYPQSNNVSFRGDQVNQIISNLNNQQQKLFKTTSKAIMKVEDEKLTNNDREVMQDIFHHLEKTSCFNSKKSSKSNLSGSIQMNSKELKKMYDQMNNQLQLLNKLIICLDNKWNLQDSKQVKLQLKEFSDKVKQLGEVTLHNSNIEQQMSDKSFRSQESSFLPRTNHTQTKEMDFSNLSEQEDSQIRQMKDIMQQYHNQTSEQSGLFQRDLNKTSFMSIKKQDSRLSSERMKENNYKMDTLINKLHHLNQSYKLLSNE
ncbi:unnamed protein product (macronuclear) [Paramecium tetraurelia]|uniref:Uncharacterized protein n=1 Tax=Paramecium tetraurelia TaxID=5888 RepID=A0BF06_PARTE|nr:uncharacterized protein GSPATT00028158001 [Paramecium tetraurelia]CAK57123.1 unnamed protein product [Paramecium tetraurelia]|eukprot:XP_001424521.1 hypothetical protein (macronuclear) [Paramecium tetraurelia strain d4-2]